MSGARNDEMTLSESSARNAAAAVDESFLVFCSTQNMPLLDRFWSAYNTHCEWNATEEDCDKRHRFAHTVDGLAVEACEVQQLADEVSSMLQKIGSLDHNALTEAEFAMARNYIFLSRRLFRCSNISRQWSTTSLQMSTTATLEGSSHCSVKLCPWIPQPWRR